MQKTPFICRLCLSRLNQSWRANRRWRVPTLALSGPSRRVSTASTPVLNNTEYIQSIDKQTRRPILDARQHSSIHKFDPYSNAEHLSRVNTSAEAGQEEVSERDFDAANYPSEDSAFWDAYEDLWKEEVHQPETSIKGPFDKRRNTVSKKIESPRKRTATDAAKSEWYHLKETSSPDDFALRSKQFRKWKARLAAMGTIMKGEVAPQPNFAIRKLRRLLKFETVESMTAAWAELPAERRSRISTNVIGSALQAEPERVQSVLEAIFQDPLPLAFVVQDTIGLLTMRLDSLPKNDQAEAAESLSRLVITLLDRSPQRYLQLKQNTIYSLLKQLKVKQAVTLYQSLQAHDHHLHTYTLLHFASCFAKTAESKELSMTILKELLQSKSLDINTPHGASLCTSILSMNKDELESERLSITPAELFQSLLGLGLRPNVITYTTIIRNLCLHRELHTAWQVFDLMRQHNIEPDAHLYSIMLNGAKLCQDFGSMRRVADLAHLANVKDPIVWNDLLHAIFVSSLIEARKKNMKPPRVLPVFGPMLRLYSRFFNTKSLEPLFLGDLKHMQDANAARWMFNDKLKSFWDNFPAFDANELLEPTSSTLGIMVLGFVRSLSKPYDMIAFYSHFRKLVKDGNPVALRIIQEQGTLVHDIVIKALLERQGLLRVGLDVVSDMLKDAATAAAAVQQSTPSMAAEKSPEPSVTSVSPAKHPAPSVFTWSILLNGFMYHRLHHQGESILHLMRRHGINPNIVTWNTIAAGYARLQRVDRTVRALQRLESAGFEADDFTLRAFSYLKNKGRAIAQMESMMKQKRERQEDLQARLASSPPLDELKQLESEVDEIAKMMEGQPTADETYDISSFDSSFATDATSST